MSTKHVIIAGGRDFEDYEKLCSDVWSVVGRYQNEEGMLEIIAMSGGANGADRLGERWAFNMGVWLEVYPADWNTYGKAAGAIRNKEMAAKADILIAFWDGKSPGTRNMIEHAIYTYNLETHIYRY